MTLWSITAAPLIAGTDIRNMADESKSILMNTEVIAVDQDAKGVQGHRVWDEGPLEIWVKPLADGSQAAGLFNRGGSTLKITLAFKALGAPSSAHLHHLSEPNTLTPLQTSYTSAVP